MLQAKLNMKYDKKVKHNKTLISTSKLRLYLDKAQLDQYFNKYRALCESESISKKEHNDSIIDLESSSSTTPSLTEGESKKTSIAINTEEDSLPYTDHNNYGCNNFMQPPYYHLNDAKYFMFPTYGIHEQSIQTLSFQDPHEGNKTVVEKGAIPFAKSKV